MNITEFGRQYGVKVTNPNQKPWTLEWTLKDKPQLDAEPVVEGKCGVLMNLLPNEQARFKGQRLVLSLLAVPRNADMNKKLNNRAKDAEAAGMKLKSKSGYETSWYFDPTNAQAARAAIKAVGARRKRSINMTEEQKQALCARLALARAVKASQNGLSG
jgi:hypothetical protein